MFHNEPRDAPSRRLTNHQPQITSHQKLCAQCEITLFNNGFLGVLPVSNPVDSVNPAEFEFEG